MQPLSHHSSNPLEARSSDNLNAGYNRLYTAAVSKQYQQGHQLSDIVILSSDDPLHCYDAPDQYSQPTKHQPVLFIDEDTEMREQEDEQEEAPEEQEQEQKPEQEQEQEPEQDQEQEQRFSPLSSPFSSPLTPLSSLPSSPASSRPPSPAESLSARPQDEQDEIMQEISFLNASIPFLGENYDVVDRLGTGTFSSVYKAIDLKYDEWDNKPWKGHHPPQSSAYYQSAGPSYRGRGGRGPGIGKDKGRDKDKARKDEAGLDPNAMAVELSEPSGKARESKVYVAIKRIYTTSGPERIRNELAVMQSCRGCRHTSQIITAYRYLDQVVLVLPYQRHIDFRDFYLTLPLEGIKSYFRCLFRALRDIHARGIIHRDVKPANFLYDPYTGIGTLCDFGLASRMEAGQLAGQCYHTPASFEDPHGKNRVLTMAQTEEVKTAQREARGTNLKASDKVGYPENDRRIVSKANRAGTRGFRAPEVLLKCGAQTGAIDVWSAGVILLFFLTGKFPIFQSNDDIEGLMEIAVIIGRRRMERTATLHSRTLATNIPSLEYEGITWQNFVERLNPKVWKLRDCDMRFYPHNSKHRDGRHGNSWLGATAGNSAAPTTVTMTDAPTDNTTTPTKPNNDAQTDTTYALQRHQREFQIIFNLLEKLLHPESTKRCTPRTALFHPMLAETAATAPLPPLSDAWATKILQGKLRTGDDAYIPHVSGQGVCGDWHTKDEVTGVECVNVLERCLCLRGGSCVENWSEDGEMEQEKEEGEKGWCGRYIKQVVELSPGEGIAIGDRPCEFHDEDIYVDYELE